jgi:hypothetical protein
VHATDALEIYKESIPGLKAALSVQSFATNWDNHKHLIRQEDLKALKFCSVALSKSSFEEVLSDEQLKDLKTKVETLYNEVFRSDEVTNLNRKLGKSFWSILKASGVRFTITQ